MAANPNPLLNTLVTFIQHQIPGLVDGAYQLTVSQRVNDSTGKPISDDTLTNQYTFAVLGDRFSLKNPAATVNSVFPPPGETGEFTTVLPHVVFQPTFPWTRIPNNTEQFQRPNPPLYLDKDVPTWLAVLLLDEDDVAAYKAQFPNFSLTPASAKVQDLFPAKFYPDSTLGSNYSYFQNATTPALDPGDQPGDPIQVLDVPLPLFWQIAPTLTDLEFTAHVRQVSLVNKPTGQGPDPGTPVGTFSIVFGTRLPQTKKKAFAYLVSLETLESFLPTSPQGGPPAGNLDSTQSLRLAVLRSWNFFSVGETATFVDGLLALNGRDPAKTPVPASNTNLRLPYSGSNPVVMNALNMGYVPLNETLRTGESTVSWYRGPLLPYLIPQRGIQLPLPSPDKALMFDPTTGMFDASYAAAWVLGRMLALQDKGFSTSIYNWKHGLSQKVVAAIEDQLLRQAFSTVLTRGPMPQALLAMQPGLEANGEPLSASAELIHKVIQALMSVAEADEDRE
jgi:hypothetical protein